MFSLSFQVMGWVGTEHSHFLPTMRILTLQDQTITHAPGIVMERGGTQIVDTQTSMVHGEDQKRRMST